MKIKWIGQQYNKDCSIACLAMILEFDIEFVYDQFSNDFDKTGITSDEVRKYLTWNGLSCIEKRTFGFDQILEINQKMLSPFADIHYISFAQFSNSKENHAVVMDKMGRIYDPANKDRVKLESGDMFEVATVLGLYYPNKNRILVKKKK